MKMKTKMQMKTKMKMTMPMQMKMQMRMMTMLMSKRTRMWTPAAVRIGSRDQLRARRIDTCPRAKAPVHQQQYSKRKMEPMAAAPARAETNAAFSQPRTRLRLTMTLKLTKKLKMRITM